MALNASASSGSDLGFGMEFYLIDSFTKVANRIKASMASLNQAANSSVKNQINANRLAASNQNLMTARQRTIAATHNATAANSRRFMAQYAATGARLRLQNQQANQVAQGQILAQRNAYWQQRVQQQSANGAVKNQIDSERLQQTRNKTIAQQEIDTRRARRDNVIQSFMDAKLEDFHQRIFERQQKNREQKERFEQRSLQKSLKQENSLRAFQGGFNEMMSGFSAIGAASIFAAPFVYALKASGEFESALIRLKVLLKSEDKAKALFEDLKQDALKLPKVEVSQLLQGSAMLISQGIEAQRARTIVNDLANVNMATGGGKLQFNNVVRNLAQIVDKKNAEGRDIKEFMTAFIPITSELKKMGINVNDGDKATFNDIVEALAQYAKVNNVAKEAMNSVEGQTAMFMENVKYIFADIGDAIKPFYISLMKYINSSANAFRQFTSSDFGKIVLRLALLASVLALVITLGYGLFKIFSGVVGMMKSMTGAAGAMAKTYGGFLPMLRSLIFTMAGLYAITKLLSSGKGSLIALGLALAVVMGPMGMFAAALVILSSGFQEWQNFMNGGTTLGAFGKIAGVLQGVWEIINNITNDGWTMNAALVKKLDDAGILGTVQKIGQIIHFLGRWWKQITFLIVTFKTLWFVMGNIKKIKDAWQLFTLTLSVAKFTLSTFGSLFSGVAAGIMRGIVAINALMIGLPLGWILAAILAIGVALALIFGPDEWRTYAKDAVYALWQGFIEFFKPFQDWIGEKLRSIFHISIPKGYDPSKATDMNEETSVGTGFDSYSYTPSDYMKDNGSDMRETQATQLKGAMSAINIQQTSQQGLQDQNINVFLDGDLMYSKMKDKGAFEQARYGV
jgi:hypothetical protein